eukprot:944846-Prorocentrum_minimum.AAC.1
MSKVLSRRSMRALCRLPSRGGRPFGTTPSGGESCLRKRANSSAFMCASWRGEVRGSGGGQEGGSEGVGRGSGGDLSIKSRRP